MAPLVDDLPVKSLKDLEAADCIPLWCRLPMLRLLNAAGKLARSPACEYDEGPSWRTEELGAEIIL